MREIILAANKDYPLEISQTTQIPYSDCLVIGAGGRNSQTSQEGLAIKTYQSDLFNNWLNTTWYNTILLNSSVSTAGNTFTIDSFILAKKIYEFLNDVAVSGGTDIDWIHAAYAHQPYSQCYSPMYYGGLSKEVVF